MSVTAVAHPNIALVKYWGKRDSDLNLPAAGSLSITLDTFTTTTRLSVSQSDRCQFNGSEQSARRLFDWLDRVWPQRPPLHVTTDNNFPTAAGLASSASGFAALAVAANALCGSAMDETALSRAARRGSGSAARSIFGGFALMHSGPEEQDCFAEPMLDPDQWPLKVVIAIADSGPKSQPSSSGMEQSRLTSPYYSRWVDTVNPDLATAADAVQRRDFEQLAEVSEHSCLKMHALMLSTRPGLIYWRGATVECLHCVRELRAGGTAVFATVDAGPQVKAVCLPEDAASVAAALSAVPGVERVQTVGLGQGARLTTP